MIFISYSRLDISSVRAIVEDLGAAGIKCWLDESSIPVGEAFVRHLAKGLREADCYLLVDTAASRSSYWVSRELQTSSRYRREGKYHTLTRLYSAECQNSNRSDWDRSIALDRLAASSIVTFLSKRSSNRFDNLADEREETVSFINQSGHGQPNIWLGRHNELRALDRWWFGTSPGNWLQALGGTGKSGLVQTWLTALSYLGYGDRVRATALYMAGRQPYTSVEQRLLTNLISLSAQTKALLILDDHEQTRPGGRLEQALAKAIGAGVRIIVTSREAVSQQWSGHFTGVSLPPMTRRDGVAFLNHHGQAGPGTAELLDAVEGHPLSLAMVCGMLAKGNRNAIQLAANLRAARDEFDGRGVSASRTTGLLRTSVRALSPETKALLTKLCRLGSEISEQPMLIDPAIRELARTGLIQTDDVDNPKKISIHPIVRQFVLKEM